MKGKRKAGGGKKERAPSAPPRKQTGRADDLLTIPHNREGR